MGDVRNYGDANKRNQPIEQADYSASVDEKGLWTVNYVFDCDSRDVLQLTPSSGASCPLEGYEVLGFKSASIQRREGRRARVTCTYTGSLTESSGDEEEELENATSTLSVGVNDEPIEANQKFKDISAADLEAAVLFKQGQIKVKVEGSTPKYYRVDKDPKTQKLKEEELDSLTPEGTKLLEYLTKGVTAFKSVNITYRMEYTSSSKLPASKLNNVGKISNPPSAPSLGGDRNWLFLGATQQFDGGNVYRIGLEWLASGASGWDDYLYS